MDECVNKFIFRTHFMSDRFTFHRIICFVVKMIFS